MLASALSSHDIHVFSPACFAIFLLQAQCTSPMHLDTALALMEEMRSRNIQPNTHTYSSLLNVCVKAGQLNMALGVYNEVRGTVLHVNNRQAFAVRKHALQFQDRLWWHSVPLAVM